MVCHDEDAVAGGAPTKQRLCKARLSTIFDLATKSSTTSNFARAAGRGPRTLAEVVLTRRKGGADTERATHACGGA
jgi:hypothetical protein